MMNFSQYAKKRAELFTFEQALPYTRNELDVLTHVHNNGPTTAADLMANSLYSRATIYRTLTSLIETHGAVMTKPGTSGIFVLNPEVVS